MPKILFDIERSLKESPPEKYYSQLGCDGAPLFPGTKFIKRIVLNRDLVTYQAHHQIRETDAGEHRVKELTSSYKQMGFLYYKPVQSIMVDPENPKRFIGLAGFGRNEAQHILGWDTAIYDVLEFDTPMHFHAFRANSNEDSDHVPALPNTKATVTKSVVNAVVDNVIPDTDAAILQYLKLIARNKPDWHKEILTKIRKEHISRHKTMRAISATRAKEAAIELNLPYEGSKNTNCKDYGYVREFGGGKSIFYDGMNFSMNNGFSDVGLITWVPEPIPTKLHIQRQQISDSFDKLEENFIKWISHYIDMPVDEVRRRGAGRFPIKLNGFFAQDFEPDANNGGSPKESGVVDINGNIIIQKNEEYIQ